MNFLCRIGLHNWGKWEVVRHCKYEFSYWILMQQRICKNCNFHQIKDRIIK